MEIQCYNCNTALNSEDNFCGKCGTKMPQELTVANYLEIYALIMEKEELSELAKSYKNTNYPNEPFLNLGNEFLGTCFCIGYNIRKAELPFNCIFKKDFRKVKHDSQIIEILKSDLDEAHKVLKIAESIEMSGNNIGLGPAIDRYAIFGLSKLKQYMDRVMSAYIEYYIDYARDNLLKEFDMPTLQEFAYRNASLGYCYKLAEELAERDS